MTDEEFIKKAKSFWFVDKVDMEKKEIYVKDPYLTSDYYYYGDNPKRIATIYMYTHSVFFEDEILDTLPPKDRARFMRLVLQYALDRCTNLKPKRLIRYMLFKKDNHKKRLKRNIKTGKFSIRDDVYESDEMSYLTKKDLYEYQKLNNYKPLTDFYIKAM